MPQSKFKRMSPKEQAKDLYTTYWTERGMYGGNIPAFKRRLKAVCHRVDPSNPDPNSDDAKALMWLDAIANYLNIDINPWLKR